MAMSMSTQLAMFAALLFIIVSSQPVYKLTNAVFKPIKLRLADSAGNPTRLGLIVHALVFFGVTLAYARANKI